MHSPSAVRTSDKHLYLSKGASVWAIALLCAPSMVGACDKKAEEGATAPTVETASVDQASDDKGAEPTPQAQPAPAMVAVELDGLGYEMDALSEWPLKKLGDGIFTFRVPVISEPGKPSMMPSLTVTKAAMGADSVEALASRCKGTLVDSGTKGEAMFQNCESETAGIVVRAAEYVIKMGDSYLTCSASGLDFELMNKVCSSLRPK